ncbi:hypothetical protein HDU76_007186, partial [Blyttiomyces sp. JEL0837]
MSQTSTTTTTDACESELDKNVPPRPPPPISSSEPTPTSPSHYNKHQKHQHHHSPPPPTTTAILSTPISSAFVMSSAESNGISSSNIGPDDPLLYHRSSKTSSTTSRVSSTRKEREREREREQRSSLAFGGVAEQPDVQQQHRETLKVSPNGGSGGKYKQREQQRGTLTQHQSPTRTYQQQQPSSHYHGYETGTTTTRVLQCSVSGNGNGNRGESSGSIVDDHKNGDGDFDADIVDGGDEGVVGSHSFVKMQQQEQQYSPTRTRTRSGGGSGGSGNVYVSSPPVSPNGKSLSTSSLLLSSSSSNRRHLNQQHLDGSVAGMSTRSVSLSASSSTGLLPPTPRFPSSRQDVEGDVGVGSLGGVGAVMPGSGLGLVCGGESGSVGGRNVDVSGSPRKIGSGGRKKSFESVGSGSSGGNRQVSQFVYGVGYSGGGVDLKQQQHLSYLLHAHHHHPSPPPPTQQQQHHNYQYQYHQSYQQSQSQLSQQGSQSVLASTIGNVQPQPQQQQQLGVSGGRVKSPSSSAPSSPRRVKSNGGGETQGNVKPETVVESAEAISDRDDAGLLGGGANRRRRFSPGGKATGEDDDNDNDVGSGGNGENGETNESGGGGNDGSNNTNNNNSSSTTAKRAPTTTTTTSRNVGLSTMLFHQVYFLVWFSLTLYVFVLSYFLTTCYHVVAKSPAAFGALGNGVRGTRRVLGGVVWWAGVLGDRVVMRVAVLYGEFVDPVVKRVFDTYIPLAMERFHQIRVHAASAAAAAAAGVGVGVATAGVNVNVNVATASASGLGGASENGNGEGVGVGASQTPTSCSTSSAGTAGGGPSVNSTPITATMNVGRGTPIAGCATPVNAPVNVLPGGANNSNNNIPVVVAETDVQLARESVVVGGGGVSDGLFIGVKPGLSGEAVPLAAPTPSAAVFGSFDLNGGGAPGGQAGPLGGLVGVAVAAEPVVSGVGGGLPLGSDREVRERGGGFVVVGHPMMISEPQMMMMGGSRFVGREYRERRDRERERERERRGTLVGDGSSLVSSTSATMASSS